MKVIAVTSGKGGTGKSCVAAYTAASLAASGSRVLLLEQGVRTLDMILGSHDRIVYDIHDVLAGACEIQEAVQPAAISKNLYLLAGGIRPGEGICPPAALEQLLRNEQVQRYDYVLLDGAALEGIPSYLVQMVLVVTTPETLCIRACSWRVQELMKAGYTRLRLVINNVPAQVLPMIDMDDFDDVIDRIGIQLIAVAPASPRLQYCSNNAQPLGGESVIPDVFDNLGARIRGENRPLLIR